MHVETFNTWSTIYEKSTGGVTRQVATHILPLLPPVTSTSVILDNAAGPGIVASEILKSNYPPNIPIHLVDASSAMISLAANLFSSYPNVKCAVMPGEQLEFPDETFTHSITNIGILVFKDGRKGAKEIWRTLKAGGVAVVTSWKRIGFAKPLAEACEAVRPGEKPFSLPIEKVWFEDGYLEGVMRGAGFGEVEMKVVVVGIEVGSLPLLFEAFRPEMIEALVGWQEEEFERLKVEFVKNGEQVAVPRGTGKVVEMCASIAVCRK